MERRTGEICDRGFRRATGRDFKLSPLVEALDRADAYGITVVSMKNDWSMVFTDMRPGQDVTAPAGDRSQARAPGLQ